MGERAGMTQLPTVRTPAGGGEGWRAVMLGGWEGAWGRGGGGWGACMTPRQSHVVCTRHMLPTARLYCCKWSATTPPREQVTAAAHTDRHKGNDNNLKRTARLLQSQYAA